MTPDPLCTQQPTGRGGWGDTHEWRHLQGHKSKRRTRESRTPTTLPREPEVLFWLCLEFRGQQLPKGWPTRPAQSRRVEREGLNERGKVLLYCGKSRRIEAMPGLRLTETDFSATKRIFLFDFPFQRFIAERKWKYAIYDLSSLDLWHSEYIFGERDISRSEYCKNGKKYWACLFTSNLILSSCRDNSSR